MILKKQKYEEYIGIFLIFFGVVIILRSFSGITGFVISEDIGTNTYSFIGFFIVILGFLVIQASKESLENLAQEVIDSRRAVTKSRELKKIANKMNYGGKEVREGYQILDEHGKPLTVIPNHREVSNGVSKKILYSLATGESTFRNYNN